MSGRAGTGQRKRVLAGMARATVELGYRDLSVRDVLERAGVSSTTFYELFESKEDCFLATFDATAARLHDRLDTATRDCTGSWHERLPLALEGLLDFVAAEPEAASILIVDSRAACPAALARRDDLLDRFACCLDSQVRAEASPGELPSALTAAGVVGGIDALLYSRLTGGEAGNLESLLPSLIYFAMLPYEGHEAASEGLAVAIG